MEFEFTRSTNFPFSCTPEFYYTVIKDTANRMGMSVSEFLREAASEKKAAFDATQQQPAAPTTQNEQ